MAYGKKIISVCLTVIMLATLLMLGLSMGMEAYAENSKVEDAQNSVVRVFVDMGGGSIGIGSGFAVGGKDEDVEYVVTNYHVVAGYLNDAYVTVTDINGGIKADVIYYDDDNDFAVLELDEKLTNRKPIALLSPKELHKSQDIYCIGFPGLSDAASGNTSFESRIKDMTITTGTVSNNDYVREGTTYILSDAKINGGNSGGPMVDEYGQAVGINTATIGEADGGDLSNNMTLAVSMDYVMDALDDLDITYIKGSANGTTQRNSNGSADTKLIIMIAGAAAVVCAAVVIIVVVVNNNKKTAAIPGGGSSNSTGGGSYSGGGYPSNYPPTPPIQPTMQRKLVVTCERGPLKGQSVSSYSSIRVGRNPSSCQLAFPDTTPGVSKMHCELSLTPGGAIVNDLGSTYGTYLSDGKKLMPGERRNVGNDGIVLLGSDKVILSVKVTY